MASFFGFARGWAATPRTAAPHLDADLVIDRSPADIAAIISGEVIPRMVALSRPRAEVIDLAAQNPHISSADIDGLVPLVLTLDAAGLHERVDRLIARGVTNETLLIDLIAPVARRLGTLWEEDRCDFIEVTMGIWRLQELVDELSAHRPRDLNHQASGRRALFATMPGDHHGFGTVLIAELFAGRGWQADRLGNVGVSDISKCLATEPYDLVGLTVSSACHMAPLPSVIRALRSVSINPRLVILVGGHAIGGDRALALEMGADGTAGDAREAAALAEKLVDAARVARANA